MFTMTHKSGGDVIIFFFQTWCFIFRLFCYCMYKYHEVSRVKESVLTFVFRILDSYFNAHYLGHVFADNLVPNWGEKRYSFHVLCGQNAGIFRCTLHNFNVVLYGIIKFYV